MTRIPKQNRWICRWTFQLPWTRTRTSRVLRLASCQTTFHPLLDHQPYLYSHGLNFEEEEDLIIEDTELGFMADSIVEDAKTESRKASVSVTATRTLQPFSWVPPSTSSAFHAMFPGASFVRTQTTSSINGSVTAFQHSTLNGPYEVDTTIPEETGMQHAAPAQDIAWPFVKMEPTLQPRKSDCPKNCDQFMQSTLLVLT